MGPRKRGVERKIVSKGLYVKIPTKEVIKKLPSKWDWLKRIFAHTEILRMFKRGSNCF